MPFGFVMATGTPVKFAYHLLSCFGLAQGYIPPKRDNFAMIPEIEKQNSLVAFRKAINTFANFNRIATPLRLKHYRKTRYIE